MSAGGNSGPTAQVGGVSINVGGHSGPFDAMIGKVVSKLNRLPNQVAAADASLKGLAQRFEEAAQAGHKFNAIASSAAQVGTVFAALGAAAGILGKAVVSNAADVESSLANASAIAGKNQAGFSGAFELMTAATVKFAAQTMYSTRDVSAAFVNLARSGMSATESVAAMPAVLRLAAASGMQLADSAQVVVGVMKGFGMGSEELVRANNVLVATFTSSNTSLGELGEAFKYVGPVAKAVGTTFEESSAALGLFANANIKATSGGTMLRRLLQDIVAPTRQGAEALEEMGLSADLLQREGLRGVIKQLTKVRGEMDATGNASKFTNAAFTAFGAQGISGVSTLAEQGVVAFDKLMSAIEGGKKSNIAGFIEAKQIDTFKGAFERMTGNLESIALVLGNTLMPAVRSIVEGFTALTDRFERLSPFMQKAIAMAFTIGTAFMVAVGAVGALAVAVGMAVPGLVTLKVALLGASVPASKFAAYLPPATTALGKFGAVLGTVGLALAVFTVAYKATAWALDEMGLGTKLDTDPFSVFGTAIDDATTNLRGFLSVALNVVATMVDLLATVTALKLIPGVSEKIEQVRAGIQARIDGNSMEGLNGPDDSYARRRAQLKDAAKAAAAATGSAVVVAGGEGGGSGSDGMTAAEKEAAFKRAQEAALAFAESMNAAQLATDRLALSSDAAREIFDIGTSFRSEQSGNQRLAHEGRLSKSAYADSLEPAIERFATELRTKVEAMPFDQFHEGLKQASSELEGLVPEKDLELFLRSFKQAAPSMSLTNDNGMGRNASELEREAKLAETAAAYAASSALRELADASRVTGRSLGDIMTNGANGGGGIRGMLNDLTSSLGVRVTAGDRDAVGGNIAESIDGLVSGGGVDLGKVVGSALGAAAPAIGAVAGGAIGSAVGAAAAGLLSDIGDTLKAVMGVVIADARVQDAATSAVGGAAVAGWATGGLAAPIGAAVGALWSLSTSTKSYERLQGALTVVTDKVVQMLEPFWAMGLPIVGLFFEIAAAFQPVIKAFTSSPGFFMMLFESLKTSATVMLYLTMAAAKLYNGFLLLLPALAYMTTLLTTGSLEKASEAALDAATAFEMIDTNAFQVAIDQMSDLTFEGAGTMGEWLARVWDAAQETEEAGGALAEAILNGPSGVRVEQYRFDSQAPSGGGGGGGRDIDGTPMLETGIIVSGDLVILGGAGAAQDMLDMIRVEGETRAAQQNGNPLSLDPVGRRPRPGPRR